MTWQKWITRGLVCAVLAALAAGVGLYALWTSPAAVRQLVQEKLGVRFLGVGVQVGSARLRLLGGILVRDLRLGRSGSIDRRDFLYVPTAYIYHDKERVLDGQVAIRRVELHKPQLRVVRQRDGRINVAGILGPVDLSERMPTMVISDGTLVFEDETSSSPLLEVHGLRLTMINDPLPTLQFEGSGVSGLLGPVRFRASVPRATLAATVELELPAVPVNADLARRLDGAYPQAAAHLAHLAGQASVSARLQVPDDPAKKLTYDVSFQLNRARFSHPILPRPLERLQLTGRLVDGVVPAATLTATCGTTRLEARAADVRLPTSAADLDEPERLAGELDATARQLVVDDDLLARLPPDLHFIKEDFSPSGPCTIRYRYRRVGLAPLVKEWVIEPHGMAGSYFDFPVPVRDVRGSIWLDTSRAPLRSIRIDLSGLACDRPATLRGTIRGEKKTSEVVLDAAGKDVLLDDRIERAVPPRVRRGASQFYPARSRQHGLAAYPLGEADVSAEFRRGHGEEHLRKQFTLTFRKTSVLYDQFPYPLENVSGVLVLYPDHWEARGFHGSHSGGEMFFDGRSLPLPGRPPEGDSSPPERVDIRISGKNILLDKEFEAALVPASGKERLALQAAWRRLRLAGRLSFSAEVTDVPGQPQDIDVTARVQGCSIRPAFFDYAMDHLQGKVRYARNVLELTEMKARHGRAELALEHGLIKLAGEGGFTAWLTGLTGQAVQPDADLLHALPESLRRVAEPLRLKGPVNVAANLTLVAPQGPSEPPQVWWRGAVGLDRAGLKAGVELTEATGQLFSEGYHSGRQLGGVKGHVHLERATVLGQPLTNLVAWLDVESRSPDTVRVRKVQAELFGGTVFGEARLETSPQLRYDVDLKALGVQLELVGRHNLPEASRKAQLQGAVEAGLHLSGEGTDLLGLKGNGRVDVPRGKMGQLPVLLGLAKAFGLREPDRTMFEQAQMLFSIEGPKILVSQLDLYGNPISLRGQGALDLDGSNINLDFLATPGRVTQMLPAGLDAIPQAISGQILKIKMRGGVGTSNPIRFDKELMPGVVEPIRRAMGGS
ncbi:MAG: AsmA-like C-terminal region-containing protein [Gemmataceae bacterium]